MAVYTILRQNNHDYSEAEKHGKVQFLFPLGVNVVNTKLIVDSARNWFKDFDFGEDYFLPVGGPVVVSLVSMCLFEEMYDTFHEAVNLLDWDKHQQTYIVRTVEYPQDEKDD